MIKPILADRSYVICFYQGHQISVEITCCPTVIEKYLDEHDAFVLGEGRDSAEARANAKKNSVPPDWYTDNESLPMPGQ